MHASYVGRVGVDRRKLEILAFARQAPGVLTDLATRRTFDVPPPDCVNVNNLLEVACFLSASTKCRRLQRN